MYSSLPLTGAWSSFGRELVGGIELALAQAHDRAGPYVVRYRSLDDAGGASGGWNSSLTAANARQVALDPRAILYIGELASGATEISLPILNLAGIPQLSPGSGYLGLTRSARGVTMPGEPGIYYPARERTFARIAPSDAVGIAGMLQALRAAGCRTTALLTSGEASVREQSGLFELGSRAYGVSVRLRGTAGREALDPRGFALRDRALAGGCLAYVGSFSLAAAAVLDAVRDLNPRSELISLGAPCLPGGPGIASLRLDPATLATLRCVLPVLPAAGYPGGKRFRKAWQHAHPGRSPGLYGIYGYAATRLVLGAISRLGASGDSRSALRSALLGRSFASSALGGFSLSRDGDTSLRLVGLYGLTPAGQPVLHRVLDPPRVPIR